MFLITCILPFKWTLLKNQHPACELLGVFCLHTHKSSAGVTVPFPISLQSHLKTNSKAPCLKNKTKSKAQTVTQLCCLNNNNNNSKIQQNHQLPCISRTANLQSSPRENAHRESGWRAFSHAGKSQLQTRQPLQIKGVSWRSVSWGSQRRVTPPAAWLQLAGDDPDLLRSDAHILQAWFRVSRVSIHRGFQLDSVPHCEALGNPHSPVLLLGTLSLSGSLTIFTLKLKIHRSLAWQFNF